MTVLSKKQMLYVSVQDRDSGNPRLKFELEDYYRRETRYIHTERPLETFDTSILMEDADYLEHLGFSLVLGFLVPGKLYNDRGPSWAQIVYPHERNGRPVLRIDEEPYEYKPHREFCSSMPLPTLDIDIAAGDDELKIRIALTVLRHLPLQVAA